MQNQKGLVGRRIFRPFDIYQQNPATCSVCNAMERTGTFIIVIVSIYMVSTLFIVSKLYLLKQKKAGLKIIFQIARLTHNFESLSCFLIKPKNEQEQQCPDLEFSAKSRSMLLRDRIAKGI
jgi:hypothetical protein